MEGLGPTPAGAAAGVGYGVARSVLFTSERIVTSINTAALDSGICRGGVDSKRMCGIVAMLLADKAAVVNQCLYDALTSLQHRGQDAAGESGLGSVLLGFVRPSFPIFSCGSTPPFPPGQAS